jgi:ATP-dependent DNA helicase RecG
MAMLNRADVDALLAQLRAGKVADDLEGETVELKPFPSQRDVLADRLREYAVCFANSQGGSLILGIKDKVAGAAAIQGCGGYDLDEMKRMVYDGTKPPILVEIEEVSAPEGVLLVVHVPRSPAIHATSTGRRLRRVGKDCQVVFPDQDITLEVEKGGDYSSKFVRGVESDALDPVEIARLRNWLTRFRPGSELSQLRDEDLLAALELTREYEGRHRPTVTGLLLVGKEAAIRAELPQSEVQFWRFNNESDPEQTVQLRRGLLAVLDRIAELIQPYNTVVTVKDGLFELPVPNWPDEVVREGLLNAVTHRSYVDTEGINVRLYRGRLEIGSPGGFIGGVRPDNILTHEPKRRNRLLAEVFQQLGLVNRAGLGVDRMFRLLLSYGKQPPEYVADADAVTLILRNGSFDEGFARYVGRKNQEGYQWSVAELIILAYLAHHDKIDARTASELIQRTASQAADLLQDMEGNFLDRFGQGRGAYYRLTRAVYDALGAEARYTRDRGIEETRQRELILNHVRTYGEIDNETCQRLCDIDRNQAYSLLKRLCDQGVLQQVGEKRGTRYRLVHSDRVQSQGAD